MSAPPVRIFAKLSAEALVLAVLSVHGTASAEEAGGDETTKIDTADGANDAEPPPEGLRPNLAKKVVEQAGVGSEEGYGYARAGVLELGGFANLTAAKGYTSIGLNPTVGWFFLNNFEVSAIIGLNYVAQTIDVNGKAVDATSTTVLALFEPS